MESVTLEIRIILLLLESSWSPEALLVACGDVTGDGLPLGNCLGALQNNDVACHKMCLGFLANFGCFFLFSLSLFFSQSKEGCDLRASPIGGVLTLLKLCLTVNCIASERKGFETVVFDRLITGFTNTV